MSAAMNVLIALDLPLERARRWAPLIDGACARWGIDTPRRVAAFVAQTAHESAGLSRLVESLDYSSASRLCEVWPRRFVSLDAALPFVRRPDRLAELVYGGRLGNSRAGDGWRYRGRGLIQITGRDNYGRAGAALGLDLIGRPELLEQPEAAAQSAAWWWASRGLNACADRDDIAGMTRIINGGLTGLEQRTALYRAAVGAIHGDANTI